MRPGSNVDNVLNDEVRNILLVRTDRIGDVILSLPMLPLLKRRFPNARITVLIRAYTRELVEHHSCVDDVLVYEHEDSFTGLWKTLQNIRSHQFDVAVIPYPRFRPTLISFLAGIPVRIGSGYRWYSFLFNRRVFEHRKDARLHEVEYNLHLLRPLGIEETKEPEFEFTITPDSVKVVERLLTEENIVPADRVAILHPGSGGSARDWSPENFSKLGDLLSTRLGLKVVVTGGKGEEVLVEKVVKGMGSRSVALAGRFSLSELGALIKRAKVFVSNSTGPLHIAAMVGTPVVGFYPPIPQCSPVRWGPWTGKKKVFLADNKSCPLCKGGSCRSNVCMDQIPVNNVVSAIEELLR